MRLGEEGAMTAAEHDAIDRVVEASEMLLDRDARPLTPRDQHPKQHGCVRARFVIEPNLPDGYGVGLFAEAGKEYPAWIRFSNGGSHDDRKPDAHGMAIKLMGVTRPKALQGDDEVSREEQDAITHDFVLVDSPIFFLPNAIEYGKFCGPLLKAKGKKPSFVRGALFFLPGKVRELATLFLLYFLWGRLGRLRVLRNFVSKRIDSPLSARYWSTTPYLFGQNGPAVKFSAVPRLKPGRPPAEASPDYLRGAMKAHLLKDAGTEADFEFRVQRQRDAQAQPVEDPTVEWDERVCPFVTVARIYIEREDFDTPGRMSFGEHLSFTPWHAIQDHRPLGGINRTRKLVYARLSKLRHELNGVPPREPGPDDPGEARPIRRPVDASQVIAEELNAIKERRARAYTTGTAADGTPLAVDRAEWEIQEPFALPPGDADRQLIEARLESQREHTLGLAFSGGGIRSGTFAVGFLQGLAHYGLLRRIDYLSTVSGGGYAGGWLAAWLKREEDPENVEKQLCTSRIHESRADRVFLPDDPGPRHEQVVDEEPEPIFHLRQYSSYLFPRFGFLTVDTWTVIAIWARNITINLMMLLPLAMMLVLLARMVVWLYGSSVRSISRPNGAITGCRGWCCFLPASSCCSGRFAGTPARWGNSARRWRPPPITGGAGPGGAGPAWSGAPTRSRSRRSWPSWA
jgi:hypothetical protein